MCQVTRRVQGLLYSVDFVIRIFQNKIVNNKSFLVILGVLLVVSVASSLVILVIRARSQTVKTNPNIAVSVNTPMATNEASQKEQTVLDNLASAASQQDKDSQEDLVAEVAVETDLVDVTGCNPVPKVVKVRADQAFEVSNTDSKPHSIDIEGYHFEIPAMSKTALIAGFGFERGEGIYTYTCDKSVQPAGALYITKN